MEQQMTKRQKSAQETRRRLLVAARKILEKKNFADVTVADIAKEAGVAVGSFYVYFKRKEDIVEVLEDYDFYHLAEIVNGMSGHGILERLAYYCHEFMKGIEEYGLEITRSGFATMSRRRECAQTERTSPSTPLTSARYMPFLKRR